jgi:hypothetical protein
MERRLDIGGTLSEAFAIYREQAGVLLPLAFWIYLVPAILEGLSDDDLLLVSLLGILSLLLGTLYEGVVVSLVRDLGDGRRDHSMGGLVGAVLPVLGTLFLAGFMAAIGIFFGTVLLIVPGLYLLTIWAVISPAIVVERRGVFDAFGRSRQLVRGNGWKVFGTVAAAMLIGILAALALGAFAESLADEFLLRAVFSALASTLTAPIIGLVIAVLYFRLCEIERERPSGEGLTAFDPTEPPPAAP